MTKYRFTGRYSSDALGSYAEGDVVELTDAQAEALERDSPGVISKRNAKDEKIADRGLHQERPDDNQTARGRERARDRMVRGGPAADALAGEVTVEGEVFGDTDGDGDPARNAVMPPEAPLVEPAPQAVPPVGETSATGDAKPKDKDK